MNTDWNRILHSLVMVYNEVAKAVAVLMFTLFVLGLVAEAWEGLQERVTAAERRVAEQQQALEVLNVELRLLEAQLLDEKSIRSKPVRELCDVKPDHRRVNDGVDAEESAE
ncbi:MAG: hypothetical protein KDA86_15965 [Planctomycetaceae bacterium]|nr:hypothetical protein [Planctomycetaceae bacterium]